MSAVELKHNNLKILLLLGLLAHPAALVAQMSVAVTPSLPSPAPLGTPITWTATVSGANPGTLWYRFRIGPMGGDLHTVVDYGPKSSLIWGAIHEGAYVIEASARSLASGETAETTTPFRLTSLVTGDTPVVTPTAHPLVFVYSAPPCAAGSRMRAQFESPEGFVQHTPYKACNGQDSMNFYIGGMRPETQYTARHMVDTGGSLVNGPDVTLPTAATSVQPPPVTSLTPGKVPAVAGLLLQSPLFSPPIATDLNVNLVWYGPSDLSFLTRAYAGGTFLGLFEDGTQDPSQQFFREFDLAGITHAETNAARVNEQLAVMGVHPINAFHHEAVKLPGGGYLLLADSDRILTDVQGPGDVDVIGDTILVLDANLQVVWAWDAFDHLDPHRAALLGETCSGKASLACAPWHLAPTANDWLHGNSLQLTPDGNILYSVRHQDWVVKIDYQNGAGTGAILWRLGKDGDFQITSADPYPWFSHQHDANFEKDNTSLLLFDDGDTRQGIDPAAHSRGQVLKIDEQNRMATLILNADLGTYSAALGSAQKLVNGHYHFDSGFIADPSGSAKPYFSQAVEVNAAGEIVFGLQIGAQEYRSIRMRDLYTP